MLLPVPIGVPPHEPANHSATAFVPRLPPVTLKVVLPPLQMTVVPLIPVGAVEKEFTVMVFSSETGLVEVQEALEIISTLILSPFAQSFRIN